MAISPPRGFRVAEVFGDKLQHRMQPRQAAGGGAIQKMCRAAGSICYFRSKEIGGGIIRFVFVVIDIIFVLLLVTFLKLFIFCST